MKRLSLLPTILIFIVVIILISLGFWQLDRAQQKKDINLALELANNADLEIIKNAEQIYNKHYYNVILNGNYITQKQFIYDNQIVEHKSGYYVLTPFAIAGSDKVIIVNRGFIAWKEGIRELSVDIDANQDISEIIVKIIPTPPKRIQLDDDEKNQTFPLIIQSIDLDFMADISRLNLIKSFALLGSDNEDGFIKKFQPYVGSVSKHIGYAIQWFLMALTLTIIGIFLIIRNNKK